MIKSHKLILLAGGFCLFLIIGLAWMSMEGSPANTSTQKSRAATPVFDVASGDTNNEVLRTILAHQQQLEKSNTKLQQQNKQLQNQRAQAVQTAVKKATHQIQQQLTTTKNTLETKLQGQQQNIQQWQAANKNNTATNSDTHTHNANQYAYVTQNEMNTPRPGRETITNANIITAAPDVSHAAPIGTAFTTDALAHNEAGMTTGAVHEFGQTINHTASNVVNGINDSVGQGSLASIPYYTIPANSTLAHAALMSALIGEVPVSGHLLAPAFPFKAIIGRRDLFAANGISLPPEIAGMVLEGYSVGNMTLSCARAYVTRALFVFHNGHFVVFPQKNTNDNATQLYPTDTLGYLSDAYGNTCINGKYITNAPQVLTNLIGISTAGGVGQAIAQAQTTTMSNAFQSSTIVSGNLAKYVGGMAIGQASKEVLNWYLHRVSDSFDAVYIPASWYHQPVRLVFNVTKTIPIDLNQHGRTLRYAQQNTYTTSTHRLD